MLDFFLTAFTASGHSCGF